MVVATGEFLEQLFLNAYVGYHWGDKSDKK